MLIADKQNLETSLRVRMLQIRERELDFFMQNMRNVAQVRRAIAPVGSGVSVGRSPRRLACRLCHLSLRSSRRS